MNRSVVILSFVLLPLIAPVASAQSYVEGAESASGDFVGPQGVRGRQNRTEEAAEDSASPDSDAKESTADTADDQPTRWLDWDRLTGDWAGHRTAMEAAGVTIESSLIAEWFGVAEGGARSHSTTRLFYDLNLTLDLGKMFEIEGGSVFADVYWIDGNSLSADAGDFQGASNIEADDRFQLSEL